MLNLPRPEKGFYYHYKHDPNGEVNNYAYEVMGVGIHTEIDNHFMVVYRPLYKSFVYNNGLDFDVRPLDMFLEEVQEVALSDGRIYSGPRFVKVEDGEVIKKLEEIRKEMWGMG